MPSTGHQLTRSSSLRVVSLVAGAIISIVLTPHVVRQLGDRLYGFWTLIGTFLGYYGVLDFGLTSAVSRHLSVALGDGRLDECNRIFNTAFRLLLTLSGVAILISVLLASLAHVICHDPNDAVLFWKLIIILGSGVALGFPLRAFTGVLVAHLRYDILSKLDLLVLVLRTSLVVWVLSSGHGILALAWVTFIPSLLYAVLIVHIGLKQYRWLRISRTQASKQTAAYLASYSLVTFVIQITDRLRYQADPFIILLFFNLSALAHYKIATLLVEQFLFLLVAIMSVVQPAFSRLYGAGREQTMVTAFFFTTKISVCIASFIGFGLIAWGKPFIARWMGTGYLDAYPPLVVLTIATTLALCQTPSVDFLYAAAKHHVYAYTNAIEGLLNVGFSLILARRYGILGVALGTLAAMTLMRLAVVPWVFCRVTKISLRSYITQCGLVLLKCIALMIPIGLLVAPGLRPHYPSLVLSVVCASLLYGAGCLYAVFDMGERNRLWSAVRLVPAV
jgi:O-antigen/teichoic acid export membrane protein